MRKLRGPHMKKSMPFENFRTKTQPVNLADLEQRFDAGDEVNPKTLKAKGLATRDDPIKILARGEISKNSRSARMASAPPPRKRLRRPAVPARLWSRNAQDHRERIQRRGHPQEARLHRGDAVPLPPRCLHPGPGVNVNAVKEIQSNFGGTSILGYLNLFSGGRLSRLACLPWASCLTSPPRSSCSC